MAKCEVIDLTLSDNDSGGDFIQAKKAIHPFLYKFLYTTLSFCTSSFYYIKLIPTTMEIISRASCMYVVMYCSLAKSDRLICIGRNWEFRFVMITSVRAK